MTAGPAPMRRPLRALVVGAGPAGLALAGALRAGGADAVVFERAEAQAPQGTGLTLWPNALAALADLGVAEAVLAVAEPCSGIEIRTDRGELLDATPGEVMWREFGSSGIALHRADLLDVLLSALGQQHVRYGARCVGYRDAGDAVVLLRADGREVPGDVLIGADGLRSTIRAQLTGHRDDLRYAGYVVYRAVTAFDVRGAPGVMSLGRGAQFGLFPMPGGRCYWFASLGAPAEAQHVSAATKERLIARFGRWHAPIPDLIAATDPGELIGSAIYDRGPVPHWGAGRVTLLGDAAHPSTPDLGQGTCQAFEDAAVLARALREQPDVVAALRAYEARRRPRADAIAAQAHRFGQVGRWQNPLACWLRNQLVKLMARRSGVEQLRATFSFDPA